MDMDIPTPPSTPTNEPVNSTESAILLKPTLAQKIIVNTSQSGQLKRYNSAPTINTMGQLPRPKQDVSDQSPSIMKMNYNDNIASVPTSPILITERIRRMSTSSSPGVMHSPNSTLKNASRLDQIKFEERINKDTLEVAHEREIRAQLSMTIEYDELALRMQSSISGDKRGGAGDTSKVEPLHVFTAPTHSPSPPPTAAAAHNQQQPLSQKSFISPNMSASVRHGTLSLNLTPSPKRRSFRRSMSPNVNLRPSSLCVKRRVDIDDDVVMAKRRLSSYMQMSPCASTNASDDDVKSFSDSPCPSPMSITPISSEPLSFTNLPTKQPAANDATK